MKYTVTIIALLFVSNITNAHYVWLEKGEDNSAHVYFGEWHKGLLEKAEKLKRFASSKIFLTDEKKPITLKLQEDYLQANIRTDADVRMLQSALPPRENKRSGGVSKTYYYAKAGRRETRPIMAFEMVPIAAGSNQLVLFFNGKPLEKTDVTVYGPPKWQQVMRTNKEGQITIKTPWAGTYLIKTSHEIEPENGKPTLKYPTIRHIFTGTIKVENGISWEEK